MFGQFTDWLGGLLGFNQQAPEALNPMAAGYQGAEASPGRTEFPAARQDAFARFTPEQRQQIGYGYLADAAMQFGGRQGTAANALMNAFDVSGGRAVPRAMATQQEPQMQFTPVQPIQSAAMPQMRPMALNIPRRQALQVPSLLGI